MCFKYSKDRYAVKNLSETVNYIHTHGVNHSQSNKYLGYMSGADK